MIRVTINRKRTINPGNKQWCHSIHVIHIHMTTNKSLVFCRTLSHIGETRKRAMQGRKVMGLPWYSGTARTFGGYRILKCMGSNPWSEFMRARGRVVGRAWVEPGRCEGPRHVRPQPGVGPE
ncbi:hypothetical protein E2C01_032104 [Portunus trituberculatus]|uniref:Uncharacterized protein n=1 Tax=Portunus trituberculatus TaxID=210409 RepID=A0A5B7EYT5_PORTR|nr:hypothetical protein [Portunus trituberculatus]